MAFSIAATTFTLPDGTAVQTVPMAKMDNAALPLGFGIELGQVLH